MQKYLVLGHALTASCMGYGHSLTPPKDVSGKAVPGWDIRILKVCQLSLQASCCCIDYSVLMYRDDIQLLDVKECFGMSSTL